MAKITYRTILVIGDNHKEIAAKYSADTKLEPYVVMKYCDAYNEKRKHLNLLEKVLSDKRLDLPSSYYDSLKEEYLFIKNISSSEYFDIMTKECSHDEKTNDAISTYNPNAYYKYERCQQHRLEVTGEEGDFSDPFPLKDGTKSYSAHFNDIDWEKIHRNPKVIELNKRVWELVVENDKPLNDHEEYLKKAMFERINYFLDNFKTKEEYLKHSTSLWYWGVATEEKYEEVDYKVSDMDWCVNFFDKYLKNLKATNPLITIYETHSLESPSMLHNKWSNQ